MKYTSSQANKLLKKLQDERSNIITLERQGYFFVAATTEDIELARPSYDYGKTQEQLRELDSQIRHVKHCINVFNATHVVDGFDMTIDQMLVYIPQLTAMKDKLGMMASELEKTRMTSNGRSNLIEYRYANYDMEKVRADYKAVTDELAKAQVALDTLNNTETMEI